MSNVLMQVERASIRFSKQTVLNEVSFNIHQGDYVAIVGPNGSGKTTLMKALLNLLPLSSGKIVRDDNLKVGYLPQKVATQDRMFPATAEEIVALGKLAYQKFPRRLSKQDENEVAELLSQFEMSAFAKTRIGLLSGGQQQRIMLARALAMRPDLLILDEPTSALDPKMRQGFYELIKNLNHQGVTIVLVSHEVASVGPYVSQLIYLDQSVLFKGTFREFCETNELSPYIHLHREEGHCQ